MKKSVICLLIPLIVFNLIFVNAAQLSISPPELFINGSIGKENCREIKITTDYNGYIILELKWSLVNSREIKDYTLNPEYFKIIEKYPEKIYFKDKDKKTINVCFDGEKSGDYNGILMFKTENSYAGIGIWIHLNLEEEKINKTKLIIYSSPTILLFFLLFLLMIRKNGSNSSK